MHACPLQLIKAPMAPDSRILKPKNFAAPKHAKNLERNATTQIKMVYPQVMPLSSKPRSVRNPEYVKYCNGYSLAAEQRSLRRLLLTRGKKRMHTRSSSFSTSAIANPFS